MDRSEQMLEQSVGKLLWSFSLPTIVGMLVNSLYNVIARIFVGRGIGFLAIAATTVAFPIMILLMAVSLLIGVGATALISIKLGEQKKDEAEKVAGNAMTMLILLPAILSVLFLLFTEPILIIFGASAEVLPFARDFTQIIMLGSVFGSVSMGMNNFIRAEGNPKMSMYTQILGAVVSIALNYVFIFKFHWGIKGSALAIILAQLVSAIWVLSYFFTGRSLIKIRWQNLKPSRPVLGSIMAIGFAPFAMQLASSIQQLILNKTLMFYGGDTALAAIGILMSISTLLFMPVLGLSQGAQPIIGFNYGAGQYKRVRETWKIAVLAGTGIALAGFLAINIWPVQLVELFSKGDTALTAMTVHAMIIFFALLPVLGFQITSSIYFQAVGKAKQAAVLSLSRQFLIFIPLLLILPHFWGVDGVWRTAPISDGLSALLTAAFIYVEMKRLSLTNSEQGCEDGEEESGSRENSPVSRQKAW
ncbi:Multi antimicrobial extrusion protein [Syntrophomonas zehnderi OL-4]|uniref:Multidrug export protein MepA n=1 Tax=Syntrophomonas zehnderi OL-4 TaxID=690567 RepID=A0A0E4C8B7_9FIRM|nr:MATE family efflux transporter [Syntrophomonas zehnderi]CFX39907.1 Multi antimicrobial extrusion protein [Syntrophomonas zehnderi OL-4]